MLLQIDFVTFKNILNKNKIFLFDTQYRIAHFRYGQYIVNKNTTNEINHIQIGGSPGLLLELINNQGPNKLYHFIDSLLVKNYAKSDWIVKQIKY
jgi:hypothetical protein